MLPYLIKLGPTIPLTILAVGALLLLLRNYWLTPIALRGSSTPVTGRAVYEPNADVVSSAAAHLGAVGRSLAALGFVATPPLRGGNATVTIYVQHHGHPKSGDVGTALVASMSATGEPVREGVYFSTHFEDGSVALTSNDTSMQGIPDRPQDTVIRLPEEDVANLHAVHQSLVRRHPGRGRRRPLGDPLAFQMEAEARSEAQMTASGWFTNDGRRIRRTWKGACFGVWRELPPWSWVGRGRARRWWAGVLAEVRRAAPPRAASRAA
jgi:hypothetical protein